MSLNTKIMCDSAAKCLINGNVLKRADSIGEMSIVNSMFPDNALITQTLFRCSDTEGRVTLLSVVFYKRVKM